MNNNGKNELKITKDLFFDKDAVFSETVLAEKNYTGFKTFSTTLAFSDNFNFYPKIYVIYCRLIIIYFLQKI